MLYSVRQVGFFLAFLVMTTLGKSQIDNNKRQSVHQKRSVQFLQDAGFDEQQVDTFMKDKRSRKVLDIVQDHQAKKKATTTTTSTTSWGSVVTTVNDDQTLTYGTEYSITVPADSAYKFTSHVFATGYTYSLAYDSDAWEVSGAFGDASNLLTACHVDHYLANGIAVDFGFRNVDDVAQDVTFTITALAQVCSFQAITVEGDITFDVDLDEGVVQWFEIDTAFASGKIITITFAESYPIDEVLFIDMSYGYAGSDLVLEAVTNPFLAQFGLLANPLYLDDNITITITLEDYICPDGRLDEEHLYCPEAGLGHYIGEYSSLSEELIGIFAPLVEENCQEFITEFSCLALYTPCDPATNLAVPICQDDWCAPLDICYSDIDIYLSSVGVDVSKCESGDNTFLASGLGDEASITELPLFTSDCDASSVVNYNFDSVVVAANDAAVYGLSSFSMMLLVLLRLY